jgi:hypothetical protein
MAARSFLACRIKAHFARGGAANRSVVCRHAKGASPNAERINNGIDLAIHFSAKPGAGFSRRENY